MTCRLDSLRDKEVINVKDGGRIGFVSDAEVDTREAQLTAVVVYGRLRLFVLIQARKSLKQSQLHIRLGKSCTFRRVERCRFRFQRIAHRIIIHGITASGRNPCA